MAVETGTMIRPLDDFNYRGKRVLLRVDINSPIDPVSKRIVNENRIDMSMPTIRHLLLHKARVGIIAHQGDTLDYQNLIPLEEHAQKLSQKLGMRVDYIDDVAGPAAREAIQRLRPGQAILLGNLRYLTEEVSTFENAVKLTPMEMLQTFLVRNLAPLFDYYVNDAFAAAHRNAPSMVAFQEILPTAGGILLIQEYSALKRVLENPEHPAVFLLGGAKISDAFGMMKQVLERGTADSILACGITGIIMLIAKGLAVGRKEEEFLKDRSLDVFIKPAMEYLDHYDERFVIPVDLAYEKDGKREEARVESLPPDRLFQDIGEATLQRFQATLAAARTIFVNGPAGVYENPLFERGTRELWTAVSKAEGYSVLGGGDSVSAAQKFIDPKKLGYVCTGGGAMIRFLTGAKLPLIEAMEKASRLPLDSPR
jgi:phosphoglycerate kinase